MENKTGKYLKYAIGEIILVVIGILIALSINNWNENRKAKAFMITNIHSISEDIEVDIIDLQRARNLLRNQGIAGKNIIPVLESSTKTIVDSLEFILQFNDLNTVVSLLEHNKTYEHLNSSGTLSEFPDKKLLKMLQNYYTAHDRLLKGIAEGATPTRLEIRKLKYELFTDTEHRKFFPTNTPIVPSPVVYQAIFSDKRILPLIRYITSTSNYFEDRVIEVNDLAKEISEYITTNYIEVKND